MHIVDKRVKIIEKCNVMKLFNIIFKKSLFFNFSYYAKGNMFGKFKIWSQHSITVIIKLSG